MKRRTRNHFFIIAITMACVAVAVVRMFGTTVSSKFQRAQTSVSSQVNFGPPPAGGNDWAPASPAASRPSAATAVEEVPQFEATRRDAVSTFALDVDTGSYTLTRKYLTDGYMPRAGEARPEEFVNYFRYDYAEPPAGRTASVRVEGAPSPFTTSADTYLLSVGLQARSLTQRVPVHLTFLIDVSGSMSSNDRLPMAKASINEAVRNLHPNDTVAIVTYSGGARVVLEPTPVRRANIVSTAVAQLQAAGGTAMSSGMELAYEMAAKHAGPGAVSRVVVMSDGDANIGSRSAHDILAQLRKWSEDGVTLSTIGFGMGNYRDDMMEQLADAGNGNYSYIDSHSEVKRVFGDRLQSMLHVVAHDVKAQIAFNPEFVRSWRQIGYENRQIADRDFRNDRVDAGEIGAGHQVTALYEVKLAPGVSRDSNIGVVRFRHRPEGAGSFREAEFDFAAVSIHPRVGHASDDFRFQAAVATFAEALSGRADVSWGWIEEVARGAEGEDIERQRFTNLVRRASEVDRRM